MGNIKHTRITHQSHIPLKSMDPPMKKKRQRPPKKELNRGPWTAEEDRKLAGAIDIHGAKLWATIAAEAGLARSSKSCRLRWMNYLRPNIKRGNMCDQEQDLIIRLHKLLGNRWSLIAARLPGLTDNEIKNYWNYHLSKKKLDDKEVKLVAAGISTKQEMGSKSSEAQNADGEEGTSAKFDDFFDFSNENPSTLEWVTKFIEFSKP